MSRTAPYQVALFGAGRIGKIHGANAAAHPGTAVKYVVDPNHEAAADLAQRLGARAVDEATALGDPFQP